MTGRGTRVARGLAAAGIATFAAAFSHVAAGGGAPGGAGFALALAFSVVVCVLLTRRALSLPLLAVSVLGSQFAFHLLFGVGSGSSSALTAVGAGPSAGHAHHVDDLAAMIPDAGAAVSSSAGMHAHDSTSMWISHAIAAMVTIAVLHRGERALRRLLALARTPLRCGAAWGRIRISLVLHLMSDAFGVGGRETAALRERLARARTRMPAVRRLVSREPVFVRLRHRGPPAFGASLPSV